MVHVCRVITKIMFSHHLSEEECDFGKIYFNCTGEEMCPVSCDGVYGRVTCIEPASCTPGCRCMHGEVQDGTSCVRTDMCPCIVIDNREYGQNQIVSANDCEVW